MVIARIQWTGDNTDEVKAFVGEHVLGGTVGESRGGVLPLTVQGVERAVPRGYWIEIVDGGLPGVVVSEEPSDG